MKPKIIHITDKPVGVQHRAADTTRADDILGWETQYSPVEGLAEIIDWYIDSQEEESVRDNLESLLHER
jgi:UDP-glucose 4-epimerase